MSVVYFVESMCTCTMDRDEADRVAKEIFKHYSDEQCTFPNPYKNYEEVIHEVHLEQPISKFMSVGSRYDYDSYMLTHDGVVYTTMTNAGYARISRFVSLPRIRDMFPVGDQWGVFVGEDNTLYVLLQCDTQISLNRKHFEYASAFTGWVDMKIHNIPKDTRCSCHSEEFEVASTYEFDLGFATYKYNIDGQIMHITTNENESAVVLTDTGKLYVFKINTDICYLIDGPTDEPIQSIRRVRDEIRGGYQTLVNTSTQSYLLRPETEVDTAYLEPVVDVAGGKVIIVDIMDNECTLVTSKGKKCKLRIANNDYTHGDNMVTCPTAGTVFEVRTE